MQVTLRGQKITMAGSEDGFAKNDQKSNLHNNEDYGFSVGRDSIMREEEGRIQSAFSGKMNGTQTVGKQFIKKSIYTSGRSISTSCLKNR